MGSAEKADSGVNKIMSGWEYAHWRSPYLKEDTQPDRLELELPMFSIIPEETLHELRKLFGHNIDVLGKDKLTILATCHIEGEVSNSRLQYMIDQHRTDITKILQDLCKQGYLLSDSKGRWTTYHLNTLFLATYVDSLQINVDTSGVELLDNLLPTNRDTSLSNVDTSNNKMDTSKDKMDSSTEDAPKSRMKKEDLEVIILGVCNSEFKTLEDIGKLIGKTPKYLKNNIIPSLIKSGRLERLYPTIINHPHQAYKAVE